MASIISAGTTSATALNMSADTSGVLQLASNNGTVALTVDTSQNVGIGTISPDKQLDVSGTSSSTTTVGIGVSVENLSFTNNTRAGIVFRNGDNYGSSIWSPRTGSSAGALVFGVNNSGGTAETNIIERARIDFNGNILVGKNADDPTAGLTLFGQTSTPGYGRINFNKTVSGTGTACEFNHNGAGVGSIQYTNTNTSYNTSSDYRLKENIQPMQNALAKVEALKPVTYTWKSDGSAGQGFIAHELQAVVPECVTGEKDATQIVDIKDEDGNIIGQEEKPAYQGVDTSFLVATLTAALQEAHGLIKDLQSRVNALENK